MSDLNRTTLTGWLVRLPVIHNSRSGAVAAMFVVAANHRCKGNSDDQRSEAAFVPCEASGAWTQALQDSQLGDKFLVAGRLKTEAPEHTDGNRSRLILVCESVHRLKTFPSDQTLNGSGMSKSAFPQETADREIPF